MTHYLTFSLQNDPDDEPLLGDDRLMTDGGTSDQSSVMDYFTTTGTMNNKQLPRSAVWVDGRSAAGNGPHIDGSGDLHADDQTVKMPERPVAVIDIFSMLSAKLGKQISQEKIAYVESIGIRVINSGRHSDNNANEESAGFAGTLSWYAPKRDRIRAYKLYRATKRIMRRDDTADNSLFSPDNKYKSLRVGPFEHPHNTAWHTVIDQSSDPFTDVTGSLSSLTEIFTALDIKNNVIDSVGGVGAPQKGLPSNRHWTSGRCLGAPDTMHFEVGVANPKSGGPGAGYSSWLWTGPQISLMNGLLVLSIDDSTTTNKWTSATAADEEFRIEVCVGLKGWKGIA